MNKFTDENITKFQPTGDAVLVKCSFKPKETLSGIILAEKDTIIDRPDRGQVISVGNIVKCVKINDFVVFDKTAGYDLYEGSDALYILMQDSKIFGIIS
jgi:co-chaperonin GroES (HSP10)